MWAVPLALLLAGAAPGEQAGPGAGAAELAAGVPVEARIGPGERHVYGLPAGAAPGVAWLLVAVEERGADVLVDLIAPDGAVLRTADSPNSRFGRETILLPGAGDGWTIAVRPSPQVAPAGAYVVALEELAASEEGGPRLAAERLTAEACRRFVEDTREGREAALAGYGEALPLWRRLGRPREEWDALYSMAVLHRLAGDPRRALAALESAREAGRALGDPRQEARILNEMGFARFSLGEVEAARGLYGQALGLWETAPDPYGTALTLNNLALSHHVRGDLRASLAPYERALALLRQAGDRRGEAVLVNNLGGVLYELGEPGEAEARFAEALAAQRRLGDVREEASVLGNLALVAQELGRYDLAAARSRQALALFRRVADARGEGRTLNGLGQLDLQIGDPARAVEQLTAALALRRQSGDRPGEAVTLGNLGSAYRALGDTAKAQEALSQALALQRELGDRRAEAITLFTLGTLLAGEGRPEEGAAQVDAALVLLRALGDRRQTCEALRHGGEIAAAAGRLDAARRQLDEALALCRAVADAPRELNALVALADVERRLGSRAAAGRRVDEALALIESQRAGLASPDQRATYLARRLGAYELAIGLRMAAHRQDPAAGHDAAALALAERARARSLLDLLSEAGAEARGGVPPELAARRRDLARRLEAKARRRLGLESGGAGARDGVRLAGLEAELRAAAGELEELDAEIRRRSPRFADLVQPRPLDAAAIQALLDDDTLLLVYSLGEERSFLWAVSRASLASFELPPRRELDRAARALSAAWRTLDPGARRADAAVAEGLSRDLLGPVAGLLAGRRLAVVPDGALSYLPFAALPRPAAAGEAAGAEPLVARHELVTLPSASVLAVQRRLLSERRPARRPESPALAVLADPVFRADDPRLPAPRPATDPPPAQRARAEPGGPADLSEAGALAETGEPAARSESLAEDSAEDWAEVRAEVSAAARPAWPGDGGPERLAWSRAEADAVARLAGPGRLLVATGFDASLDLLTGGDLGSYDVLHLATHGVVDDARPALSGLVLSLVDRAGRERPGFLTLAEVYDLDLAADLVVLSGCETALGKEVRGEGLLGLARGFLHAGAARVLASLWRVQDRATAELMRRFYEALLVDHQRPAAALRRAQVSMLHDMRWSDPYHWAGFTLTGDWR